MPTLELDRIRRHTAARANQRIDADTAENIHRYAGLTQSALAARLDELDREWDVERVLEANAAVLALTGVGLAAINRRWLLLTTGVLGFLLLHAAQGWCPPLPVIRRLGVRTRSEIDREKMALRFLRGDFDQIRPEGTPLSVPRLLHAL